MRSPTPWPSTGTTGSHASSVNASKSVTAEDRSASRRYVVPDGDTPATGDTYYSVEVQLGKVDASHSFRVFDYRARNRRRFPGSWRSSKKDPAFTKRHDGRIFYQRIRGGFVDLPTYESALTSVEIPDDSRADR